MYSYKDSIVLVHNYQAFITAFQCKQWRAIEVAKPMKYQIQISQHEKALCNVEIVQLQNPKAALRDILERFPASEGYRSQVLVAEDEKRILEVSREGIKLLSSIPDFKPVALP